MLNILKLGIARLTKALGCHPHPPRQSRIQFRPVLEILETRLVPTTYTWTGDGITSNWSDGQNWRHLVDGLPVAGAPPSGSDISFGGAGANGNLDCTVDAAALPAQGGVGEGTLNRFEIVGYTGTITLGRDLRVTDRFEQHRGTLTGPYSLTILNRGVWDGGIQGGDSTASSVLNVQGSLTVSGAVTLNGRRLENYGTLDWAAATIAALNNGKIVNEFGGVVNVYSLAVPGTPAAFSGDGEFINRGLLAEEASSELTISVPMTSNQGSLVANGKITFESSSVLHGGNPAGGQTANLAGTGQILFSGYLMINGNTTSEVSVLNLNGGTSVAAAFTVDGASTCTLNSAASISGAGASITVNANLTIISDLVINAGNLTNNSFGATGTLWNAGSISIQGNGAVVNNANFTIGSALDNAGAVIGSAKILSGAGTFTNNRTLRVGASATFSVPFTNANNSNLELNAGTLTITSAWTQGNGAATTFSGGNLQVNGDFTNNGNVDIFTSGQLAVNTFTNNNRVTFWQRVGPPVVPSTFTVAARPGAPGTGNFTQGDDGLLWMRITGTNNNDRVVVDGTATLGGTLWTQVRAPVEANSSWALISGTRVGLFDTVNQPGGYGFSAPTFGPASVSVQNPDIQVPGPQVIVQDTALVFAPANNNAISIPDPDAGAALLQMTLSATNGTLTLGGTMGLTFSTGTGYGDTSMTFIGTIDSINAALNGLNFSPTQNYHGPAWLNIIAADTPESGGSFSQDVVVPISVVNQPPNLEPPPDVTIDEGWTQNVALMCSDPEGDTLTYSLAQGTPAFASIDPQSGMITLSPDDGPATFTITVLVSDGINTTSGSFQVFVTNVAPTAMPMIDAPNGYLVNTPINLTLAFANDPSQADRIAGFTYSFDLNEDGDYNDEGEGASASNSRDFVFATAGWHTLRARITDKDGAYTEYAIQIWVNLS